MVVCYFLIIATPRSLLPLCTFSSSLWICIFKIIHHRHHPQFHHYCGFSINFHQFSSISLLLGHLGITSSSPDQASNTCWLGSLTQSYLEIFADLIFGLCGLGFFDNPIVSCSFDTSASPRTTNRVLSLFFYII